MLICADLGTGLFGEARTITVAEVARVSPEEGAAILNKVRDLKEKAAPIR